MYLSLDGGQLEIQDFLPPFEGNHYRGKPSGRQYRRLIHRNILTFINAQTGLREPREVDLGLAENAHGLGLAENGDGLRAATFFSRFGLLSLRWGPEISIMESMP
jgi:hypothetical protein